MNYEVILYCGIAGSIIALIFTIVIFIRGNVLNLLKDLIGTRKFKEKDKKNIQEIKIKPKNNEYKQTEVMGIKYKEKKAESVKEVVTAKEVVTEESGTQLLEKDTTILSEYNPNKIEGTSLLNEVNIEQTSLLNEDGLEGTSLLNEVNIEQTSLLGEDEIEETSLLGEDEIEETSLLGEDEIEETSLLGEDEIEETSLLGEDDILGENKYIIEKDIMVINCKMVI